MGVHQTRRVGWIYLVLVVGGGVGGIALARAFHLGAAATAISVLTAMAPLFLAWAAFRADRQEAAAAQTVDDLADRLAHAVRGQWEAEARVRHLNDPFPLPISWRAASDHLVEPWPMVLTTAASWPTAPSVDPTGWASNAAELAGQGSEIAEVFCRRIPTRRLVVLGPPGAGKTMLLLRLLLALLVQRTADGGGPVPVLFPLASWNPAQRDLYDWMADRLAWDHPELAAPAPAPALAGQVSGARALLDHGLILPVLDGFDELPAAVRAPAIDEINQTLPFGRGLVLSSRVEEYRRALQPAGGVTVRLAGAAGIELRPLDPGAAAAYLRRYTDEDGNPATSRWNPVAVQLGTDSPVGRALRTPLMLFLTHTMYNPRPGEDSGGFPDPGELCDPGRFPTQTAVESHLHAGFIPAAYRRHPRYPCRWSPKEAEQALVFLARHLEGTLGGTPDLAWWQLGRAVPRHLPAFVLGLTVALGVALPVVLTIGRSGGVLYGIGVGLYVGLVTALVSGFLFGVGARFAKWQVPAEIQWSWSRSGLRAGLWAGLVGLLLGGLPVGFGEGRVGDGVVAGLSIGLGTALLVGFVWGFMNPDSGPADLAGEVGPAAHLRKDRRTFRKSMLRYTVVYGWLVPPIGLFLGLGLGFCQTAWGFFVFARCYLALRRRFPLSVMAFLADAHERRGVLRQVGVVYQFRHIELQRRLALRR